jgi:cytoskeletal protein RodZ
MTSIGDTLRRERLRRNLELSKIAGELKISTRFLEAMEADDLAKLPGGVFTKSFVRQYAVFLGLDADELLAEVGRIIDPKPEVPQGPTPHKPEVKGIEVEKLEENWQSVHHRSNPVPSWVRAGVLLVALMVVCSGVYYWTEQRSHRVLAHETAAPPPIPVTQSSPAMSQAPAPSVAAAPVSESPTSEPAAKPAVAESTPVVQPTPPNPNATVRVGITADEQVWVRADVNGKMQFATTLQPHETRNIDADGEVVLRLGNAGGATITLNGKPVGAVGPKGQIRTVQFTSGGFQIVSAPKPDPLDRL